MKRLLIFFSFLAVGVLGEKNYVLAQEDPNTVKIILESHGVSDYSEGGVQMLLDNTASTYGILFTATDFYFSGKYESFSYKLPENASPDFSSNTFIADGKDSIMIPPGIYDYLIVSPSLGGSGMLFNGMFSRFDDFEFKSEGTYHFKIVRIPNQYGFYEYVAALSASTDVRPDSLLLPQDGLDMGRSETIMVRIRNEGITPVENIPVCYRINGGETVREVCTQQVQPGQSVIYAFGTKADFSEERLYTVKVWTEMESDLIPYTDTITGECFHRSVYDMPYKYDFSTEASLKYDWITLDCNQDGNTWMVNEYIEGPDGQMGIVTVSSFMGQADDWLITPSPINMVAGTNHAKFFLRSFVGEGYAQGILKFLVGPEPDPASMRELETFTVYTEDWLERGVSIEVEKEGPYYIAFHAVSNSGAVLQLDALSVDEGLYKMHGDLKIDRLVLPLSNCNLLSETPVKVLLHNIGMASAENMVMELYFQDELISTESFLGSVRPDSIAEFTFRKTVDMSLPGNYKIRVLVKYGADQVESFQEVHNQETLKTMPFISDFSTNEGIDTTWIQLTPGTWEYQEIGQRLETRSKGMENGLMSRCLTMEGSYRARFSFYGGQWGDYSDVVVLFGKANTDMFTWDTLYRNDTCLDYNEVELSFSVPEKGEYNILIYNSENSKQRLALVQFSIFENYEYDIAIVSVDNPLSAYTPCQQSAGRRRIGVEVKNVGMSDVSNVKVRIFQNENLLGVSDRNLDLAVGTSDWIDLDVDFPFSEAGVEQQYKLEAFMEVKDSYPEDNIYVLGTVHITDSVFATENLTDFELGIGETGSPINMGNVYTLTNADTLSSITIGLASRYGQFLKMGLAVYSIGEDGRLDRVLYELETERPQEAGFHEFALSPARILPKGAYYFEVRQVDGNNMGLSYVSVREDAVVYRRMGDSLQPNVMGIGLAIRANFASGKRVVSRDAAISGIVLPLHDTAVFSEDETVSVKVENLGYEPMENVLLELRFNDKREEKNIALLPYESKYVLFDGLDFEDEGSYRLVSSVHSPDDHDNTNDSLDRILYSWGPQDPFFLDFEKCNDFDTLLFNQEWISFDVRQEYTNAWMHDYPGKNRPVGFIAFNPLRTNPSMQGEMEVPGFSPYEGKRFGAAFAPGWGIGGQADVWLISPKFILGSHPFLEMYVKTPDLTSPDGQLEPYEIWVSEEGTDPKDFVRVGDVRQAPEKWTLVRQDLDEYSAKEVHVGIRYVGRCEGNVCLMLDNIKIGDESVSNLIRERDDLKLRVILNSSGKLWLGCEEEMLSVEIFNTAGKLVYRDCGLRTHETNIDVSSWYSGVYIGRVRIDRTTMSFKIVVL